MRYALSFCALAVIGTVLAPTTSDAGWRKRCRGGGNSDVYYNSGGVYYSGGGYWSSDGLTYYYYPAGNSTTSGYAATPATNQGVTQSGYYDPATGSLVQRSFDSQRTTAAAGERVIRKGDQIPTGWTIVGETNGSWGGVSPNAWIIRQTTTVQDGQQRFQETDRNLQDQNRNLLDPNRPREFQNEGRFRVPVVPAPDGSTTTPREGSTSVPREGSVTPPREERLRDAGSVVPRDAGSTTTPPKEPERTGATTPPPAPAPRRDNERPNDGTNTPPSRSTTPPPPPQ